MPTVIDNPFSEDEVEEVRLNPAPLEKVLCQLRFPRVFGLTRVDELAAFQDVIRAEYPILRQERHQSVVLSEDGVAASGAEDVFRFSNRTDDWTVSLAQGFVALETTAYTNREDFIDRLARVLSALHKMAEPSPVAQVDRLGIRYLNRLTGMEAERERLRELVREDVFGPLSIESGLGDGNTLVASISQTHFRLDELSMQARWASLPAGELLAPGIDAVPEPSWVLDVDVFTETPVAFEPEALAATARHAAKHAYRFFRWAMTEEFILTRLVDK